MALSGLLAVISGLALPHVRAQEAPKNLQVLPKDWTRQQVVAQMRDFSFATGFRCEGCHYDPVGEGNFRDIDFASDENPRKNKARFMIRMTRMLNENVLSLLQGESEASHPVTCKTCHRGINRPALLGQDLLLTVRESGVDSAVTRYRHLRGTRGLRGVYDFGEWETNELAADLAAEGRTEDAIVIYRLNAEFHQESASIQVALGELYAEIGDNEAALSAFEKAITLGARREWVQQQIDAIRSGQ